MTNQIFKADAAHIVATVVSVGFVIFMMILAFHMVADSPLMNVMAGSLATSFTGVVQYYLGSSLSSTQKSDQISQMIAAGQTAIATVAEPAPTTPPAQ